MPLGEVGDPSSQAENSVASVAQEAIWQASAQNRRRETGVFVSDIAVILVSAAVPLVARIGKIKATPNRR
jgi:hypothetical protein